MRRGGQIACRGEGRRRRGQAWCFKTPSRTRGQRGEPLYDLVILDLPGARGATISAIRALPGLRGRVPIVALGTGAALADVRGIDRLDTPLRPHLLVERVRYRLAAADPRVADMPVLDRVAFET